tara:strand:- start:238 stop:384 length:147 start_codon:yes stop_codon:yes gene_type:complete
MGEEICTGREEWIYRERREDIDGGKRGYTEREDDVEVGEDTGRKEEDI